MMKTAEAKDCGPLGEIAEVVSRKICGELDEVLEQYPTLEIVFVVVPGGNIAGGAVVNARHSRSKDTEAMIAQLEETQTILRRGAESCGRALFESPGSLREVAEESAFIRHESRCAFESWKAKRCEHPEHGIREAATMVATGVRILGELGAPDSVLVDLTRICKEACRRAHTAILRVKARTHAQA